MARLVLLMLACASMAVFVAAESKGSITVNGVSMSVDQLAGLNSPLADALLKAQGVVPKVSIASDSYVKRHGKKSKYDEDYKYEYKKYEEGYDKEYYGKEGEYYGPEYGYDGYKSYYGGYYESHKYMCLLEKDGGRSFGLGNVMTSELTCCEGPHGEYPHEYYENPVKDYYESHPDHKFLTSDGKLKAGMDQTTVGTCTWNWDLSDASLCPVQSDEGVTCLGKATAECVITNPACGDPLCKGLTITFRGVINSMYAYVKTPKPAPGGVKVQYAYDGADGPEPHKSCGIVYVAHGTITNTVAPLGSHPFPWANGIMEFTGLFQGDNFIIPADGLGGAIKKQLDAKVKAPTNAKDVAPVPTPCEIAHAPLVNVGEYKILFTK